MVGRCIGFKGTLSRRFCFTLAKTVQEAYNQSGCNLKLLLQHQEENNKVFLLGRTNCGQFLATSPKYTRITQKVGQFCQVAIHFHPSHPQPNIINTSFCALVGSLLTKLNHYFNDSIETNAFLGYS